MPTQRTPANKRLYPCHCNLGCSNYTYQENGKERAGFLWTHSELLKHQNKVPVAASSTDLNPNSSRPSYPTTSLQNAASLEARTQKQKSQDQNKFPHSNNTLRSPVQMDQTMIQQLDNPASRSKTNDSLSLPLLGDILPTCLISQESFLNCQPTPRTIETELLHHKLFNVLSIPTSTRISVLHAASQYLIHRSSIISVNTILKKDGAGHMESSKNSISQIPKTIGTVLRRLNILPNLSSSICCPKCYSLYPLDTLIAYCTHQGTPRSRICDEPLFSASKQTPRRFYTTYSVFEWLGRFFNRPGVEDLLDKSLDNKVDSSGIMFDIWDSPMWTNERQSDGTPYSSHSGNLSFALGVDWFNPWGNKAAGKSASLGALVLVCLNLPLTHRYLPENIFIAGITPGPKEPTVLQIGKILQPMVDEFIELWEGVKLSGTYRHPREGRIVRGMILQVICDLPAVRKVMGLAGHSSKNHPCTFCKISSDRFETTDTILMVPRQNSEVREAAAKWQSADTWVKRKKLFADSGVRYTPLLQLPYIRPVSHLVVEPMHNIFLGILKFHGQTVLGLKAPKEEKTISNSPLEAKILGPDQSSNSEDDEDIFVQTELKQTLGILLEEIVDSDSASDLSYIPDEEENSNDSEDCFTDTNDSDDELPKNPKGLFGNTDNTQLLHSIIETIILPSWVGRVPRNVGQVSGGKLKADEWAILFTVILVPVVGILCYGKNKQSQEILDNFLHLISAANIIRQSEIHLREVKSLRIHIQKYLKSLQTIFPNVKYRPNHHLALHIPECMARSGPATGWTGWVYERLNGHLQAIRTNKQMRTLDKSYLKNYVSLVNFKAALPILCKNLPEKVKELLLQSLKAPFNDENLPTILDSSWSCKKLEKLDVDSISRIMTRLQAVEVSSSWEQHDQLPHFQY
ncbi:hypothetical protein PCASD_10226 [Puccinia coronata f. sp. avenae]|uniref:Transposase domain-containing protein n=1 Tax=Puccinia coronata f. sp. avenae TaxID=200324 RepID=A0A2N5UD67_9BASI|nr:hypothetical protein PCASD_10226 [Puccinia coronata f. sp. avenae]